MTSIKFHAEDPQTVGATAQNTVTLNLFHCCCRLPY